MLSILCKPEVPEGHAMQAQYLAHGVPDKRNRGSPCKRASDGKTL